MLNVSFRVSLSGDIVVESKPQAMDRINEIFVPKAWQNDGLDLCAMVVEITGHGEIAPPPAAIPVPYVAPAPAGPSLAEVMLERMCIKVENAIRAYDRTDVPALDDLEGYVTEVREALGLGMSEADAAEADAEDEARAHLEVQAHRALAETVPAPAPRADEYDPFAEE